MSTETEQMQRSEERPPSGRSALYWFCENSRKRLGALYRVHRGALITAIVLLSILLFLFRSLFHPAVLALRIHLFPILLVGALAALFVAQAGEGSGRRRLIVLSAAAVLLIALVGWGGGFYRYLALYQRYRSLKIVDLAQLPISEHERIQPRASIYSLAHEVMTEDEQPAYPDLVRVGGEYRWTYAIEPAYPFSRLFGEVREVMSTAVTDPSPNLAKEYRIPVQFAVGEHLMLSHNSHTSTIRSFGLLRFLSYEPADAMYFPNAEGRWVQVVSLIRWKGFFFPRPEFGGVQLIEQEAPSLLRTIRRILFGIGTWVPPEQIANHPYLSGQNIISPVVTRYAADSFRFQQGFLAPLPGYHRGDVRVPDSEDDRLDQPFTGYFILPGKDKGELFHYFGLEPLSKEKQGLNISLFMPADGRPELYVYRHHERGGSLTGVSAISAKVMESRKIYDWTMNRPAEHRPFLREINGEVRFFWLTTVVTYKEELGAKRFIAGSTPDVVLTDARYNVSVWVDPLAPGTWAAQLQKELAAVWGKHVEGENRSITR